VYNRHFVTFIGTIIVTSLCYCQNNTGKARQAVNIYEVMEAPSEEMGLFKSSAMIWLKIYKSVISSQDGPTCVFNPSCGTYTIYAINRFGVIKGVLLAADRLQRCHTLETEHYTNDGKKLLDPLPDEL